ncbi:MAG TPA: RNA polymerase sigma factor [Kofleriaceae bacterium]
MQSNAERLRHLLAPVHDRAQSFARGLCRSRADGDDLYQEALLRAIAKLDGLRDDAAYRPWLYSVVISVHRNRARREFWRRLVPLGDDDHAQLGAQPYRATDWSPDAAEAAARARAALATLPAVQRETIVLFELEGWQVDEIAGLHRVSASAVKSRLARGRDRLRSYYERAAEARPPIVARAATGPTGSAGGDSP